MFFLVIMGCVALLLLLLGILMRRGKGLMLLAGYNTMPEKSRNAIDKAVLSKLAGNLMLRLALYFILLGFAVYFELGWLSFIAIIAAIADPCVSSIRMSAIVPKDVAPTSKVGIIATVVICAVTFAGVGMLFYFGEKDPVVSVQENQIQIEGMYGLQIGLSDIEEVLLLDKSMSEIGVGRRTNGYGGFGPSLKGNFSSDALGKHLLFVNSHSSPTLQIRRTQGPDIFISFKEPEQTEELYADIQDSIQNL